MIITKNVILKYLPRALGSISSDIEIIDKVSYLNFRCPFCGDSKKSKKKKRGNINLKGIDPYFRCFNCDTNYNMFNFFKTLDDQIYKEFCRDVYLTHTPIKKEVKSKPIKKQSNKEFLEYIKDYSIEDTDGLIYLKTRGIPITKYILNNLYYHENLGEIYDKFFPNKTKIYGKGIFIPTYNLKKEINGFQIRLLNSKIRYVTLKLGDNNMIFNLPNLNPKKHIYINEGFFDGQFLVNSLNTNLPGIKSLVKTLNKKISKENLTIVLDNERSNEIKKLMEYFINNNFNLFIWPKDIPNEVNDINDLYNYMFKGKRKELIEFINKNTYNGIKARIFYDKWYHKF